MTNPIIDVLSGAIKPLLDKFFPDAKDKEAFQLAMNQQLQSMDMADLENSYKAIISEAQSTDKWTSRARPSFMYVIYLLFLTAIPYGIWYAIHPSSANNFQIGLAAFFKAIPDILYQTFGVGYVGYSAARSYDKHVEKKYSK